MPKASFLEFTYAFFGWRSCFFIWFAWSCSLIWFMYQIAIQILTNWDLVIITYWNQFSHRSHSWAAFQLCPITRFNLNCRNFTINDRWCLNLCRFLLVNVLKLIFNFNWWLNFILWKLNLNWKYDFFFLIKDISLALVLLNFYSELH